MAESMRELQLKEKERDEKRQAKEEKKATMVRKDAAQSAKKWKGKDWFVIFSPKMFGERAVGETPATNPKTLTGRNIEVSMSDLTGQYGKDFYRVMLVVERIDGNSLHTRFNGYTALKEHVMRVIRKRTQKIESIMYIDTKDKWRLQISTIAILNRNTEVSVRKKVRAHIEKSLEEIASNSSIDDFIKSIVSTNLQRGIKKSGTKIYPVRFFEVSKIEVKGVPSEKPEAARPEEAGKSVAVKA